MTSTPSGGVIPTTGVVGFVIAGSPGREVRPVLGYLPYRGWPAVFWYLVLVEAVNRLSAWLRRLARSG